nr:hypothetical protein [Marinicella sp. W31]MDC2876942.1 hypothetical protein [Marinicella sp. W31]
MKSLKLTLAASAAVIAGFAASGASAQEDVKACFVYVGSATDGGWTQAHDIARQELEDTLGVETAYIENVPEGRMPSAPSNAWPVPAAPSSSPPPSASWNRRSRSPPNIRM